MKIVIEKNAAKGIGYQIVLQDDPFYKVYQEGAELMDLQKACGFARFLLDEYNQAHGTDYAPENTIGIDEEAFEANARRDVNAARGWKEIKQGKLQDLSYSPMDAEEIYRSQTKVERGGMKNGAQQMKINITPEGLFLTILQVVIEHPSDVDVALYSKIVDGFCRLIASRGYGKGAAQIRTDIDRMDKNQAITWAHYTIAQYRVTPDDFNILASEADEETR